MGTFLVILSALGFSTLGIFGKLAFEAGFTRNQTLLWRFLFALPFLWLILLITRSLPKLGAREGRNSFLRAVALGMVGIGFEATLYFLTLKEVGAALTGIFLYLYPSFVALISHYFLKQKLSRSQWLCIALSLLGCVLTADLQNFGSSECKVTMLGLIYGVLTALWYAVYLLMGSRVSKNENPLTVSGGVTAGSFLIFAVLTGYEIFFSSAPSVSLKVPMSMSEWGAILGIALFSTVLPFTTLYAGMKRVGPTQTAILSTLEMVFTIILAALFLGEKLTVLQSFGAFLILLSVILIQRVTPAKR